MNKHQLQMMRYGIFRPGIRITPDIKRKHQMEIIEEAWKLFNWMHNEEMKKQKSLNDY